MDQQNLAVTSCGTEWDVIRKCICSAYYHQAARLKVKSVYVYMYTYNDGYCNYRVLENMLIVGLVCHAIFTLPVPYMVWGLPLIILFIMNLS